MTPQPEEHALKLWTVTSPRSHVLLTFSTCACGWRYASPSPVDVAERWVIHFDANELVRLGVPDAS